MRTVEAIETIKSNYPSENYTMLREAIDTAIELLEAEKDGRVVVLPCKSGTIVYTFQTPCEYCESYLDNPVGCSSCKKPDAIEEIAFDMTMYPLLGHIVFLTKEQAEVALAEMEGK